jgi:hypothetical protein
MALHLLPHPAQLRNFLGGPGDLDGTVSADILPRMIGRNPPLAGTYPRYVGCLSLQFQHGTKENWEFKMELRKKLLNLPEDYTHTNPLDLQRAQPKSRHLLFAKKAHEFI